MKTLACTLFFTITSVFCIKAQITFSHNGIRLGDEIIKQQVEYKEPGEAGKNQVWDFSKLKTINDAYTLTYDLPPIQGDSLYMMGDNHFDVKNIDENELIVGTEHNTMYYYRLINDSLLLLGHENPSVRLSYIRPIVDNIYPFNYGQTTAVNYESKGLYSATVDIHTKGNVQIQADAFGKMILPTGDTLNPVLRIKTTKLISNVQQEQTDSASTDKGTQLETYKWYTKGYRYPVFETIRNINLDDNSEIFTTAFFFPPQDHFYLDTDPENLAVLDSLWNVKEEREEREELLKSSKEIPFTTTMSYKIYPNPVTTTLFVEYTIEEQTMPVNIQLYTMDGRLVKHINKMNQTKGNYTEQINCDNLSNGNYLVILNVGDKKINQKVIKK